MDEIILNSTGSAWTGYNWNVSGPFAAINKLSTTTSGFSIAPFTTTAWVSASGWDASHASEMDAAGGAVAIGATYKPGLTQGSLFIDANLSLSDSSFTMTQGPVPEPATISLLAGGLVAVLARRRTR